MERRRSFQMHFFHFYPMGGRRLGLEIVLESLGSGERERERIVILLLHTRIIGYKQYGQQLLLYS